MALVRGLTPREALDVLAPDAATPIESARAAARWTSGGNVPMSREIIEARALPRGWTLILDSSIRVLEQPYLRRLAAQKTAVVTLQAGEADLVFLVARAVRVVRGFVPSHYAPPWSGTPSREERAIRFGERSDPDVVAKCMLLAARLTGLRLSEAELAPRHFVAVGIAR